MDDGGDHGCTTGGGGSWAMIHFSRAKGWMGDGPVRVEKRISCGLLSLSSLLRFPLD